MSESVAIADIYKLFEQTNAALERSREEFDRRAAEADRRAAEFDRSMAESRAEFDRRIAKLEKTVERTAKSIDSLTTCWGKFEEELVRSAVVRMFRDLGLMINHTMERVKSPIGFEYPMEIDILGVNGDSLVAVECKSRLSKDDVDETCDRRKEIKDRKFISANADISRELS